jgi:hypothetical protein
MSIRKRIASTGLAAVMALTAIGVIGAGVSANSGHGGPLETIADIEDAQASYSAGKYLQANREAVITLRALRHLRAEHATIPFLTSIGCGDEYRDWFNKAIAKMVALRLAAFGQGTKWAWAANPRLERTLALAVYRRANARYHTSEDAFIDCVLNAVDGLGTDFILELSF